MSAEKYLNADERCDRLEKEVKQLRADLIELRRLVVPLDPIPQQQAEA